MALDAIWLEVLIILSIAIKIITNQYAIISLLVGYIFLLTTILFVLNIHALPRQRNVGRRTLGEYYRNDIEPYLIRILFLTLMTVLLVWLCVQARDDILKFVITPNFGKEYGTAIIASAAIAFYTFVDVALMLLLFNMLNHGGFLSLRNIIRTVRRFEWVILTVSLMIALFIGGIFIINSAYGLHALNLILKDENLSGVGNFTCQGTDGDDITLADEYVACTAFVDNSPASYKIKFTLQNGTITNHTSNENEFQIPKNLKSTFVDATNFGKEATSYWVYRFKSADEYEKTKETLVSYIAALLAAVLFSVPTAMKNLKDMIEREEPRTAPRTANAAP